MQPCVCGSNAVRSPHSLYPSPREPNRAASRRDAVLDVDVVHARSRLVLLGPCSHFNLFGWSEAFEPKMFFACCCVGCMQHFDYLSHSSPPKSTRLTSTISAVKPSRSIATHRFSRIPLPPDPPHSTPSGHRIPAHHGVRKRSIANTFTAT